MWTTDKLGLAVWSNGQSAWQFDVRGGNFGIGLVAPPVSTASQPSNRDQCLTSTSAVTLASASGTLPLASEQYVRGGRWHINYPQDGGRYAIRLALEPIESDADSIVIEATIAIQTDLLDSHPTIDLVAKGKEVRPINQANSGDAGAPQIASASTPCGSPSISRVMAEECSTAILLGPHDSPFTQNLSCDHELRLRLFGDFLEKGVIRTARPWIVIDRGSDSELSKRLARLHRQLSSSPLPLSS